MNMLAILQYVYCNSNQIIGKNVFHSRPNHSELKAFKFA